MRVTRGAPWLLLAFSLPKQSGSVRVAVWRKLHRFGALPLGNSGYLIPNSADNREKFEWLATTIRSQHGEASVVDVQGIDNRPHSVLKQQFIAGREREYGDLLADIKKASKSAKGATAAHVARFNQRLQEVVSRDFFGALLRKQVEVELERLREPNRSLTRAETAQVSARSYKGRLWVTRPRPGVDRVTSAWLIRRFIDPRARFAFAPESKRPRNAVPFDMYEGGFGHRGENCTFETLTLDFRVRDSRVVRMAEIVHDADLFDDKFGRREGFGIDAVMKGWAREDVSDQELLARGMQLAEGLYRSLS